jgi:stage II sporulation protein E
MAGSLLIEKLTAPKKKKKEMYMMLLFVFAINILFGSFTVKIPKWLTGTEEPTVTFWVIAGVAAAEAFLWAAAVFVGKKGLLLLVKEESSRFHRNEEMISSIFLVAMALWGIPEKPVGIFNMTLSAAYLVLLFSVCKFGVGLGTGIAGICGIILSIRLEIPEYVGAFFVLSLALAVALTLGNRRKISAAIGFLVTYVILGVIYLPELFYMEELVAMAIAIGLFMLIPKELTAPRDGNAFNEHSAETAREITRITADKIRELAGAFRRIEYTLAGCEPVGVRMNLGEIGELIGRFSDNLEQVEAVRNSKEDVLRSLMLEQGVEVSHLTAVRDELGRKKYYITACSRGRKIMLSKDAADILAGVFGENIRAADNTPAIISENERVIAFEENPRYKATYEVRRVKKYGSVVSGDSFSVKEDSWGRLIMMISDGMGSGSLAACESELIVDTMEEMMEAGFEPLYGIAFSNECISAKNNGRVFTTFDMGIIDLYQGELSLYKQGGAPTYIVRNGEKDESENEPEIQEICGTTLPIGIVPGVECDTSTWKLSEGDTVIMISDGALSNAMDERITDLKKEILGEKNKQDCRNMADGIMEYLMSVNHGRFLDDVTLIVARLEGR